MMAACARDGRTGTMFIERDRVPEGDDDFDWRFIPLGIAFITAFWGTYALLGLGAIAIYHALFIHIHGAPVYLELGIGGMCFFLIVLVYALRNWRSVAWLQILISIVGGVVSLVGGDFSLSGVLGSAFAVFGGANGFKRLHEVDAAEKVQK